MAELKRVKIGFVGVGWMGEFHIAPYQANPLCDLVAVCDVSEKRVKEIQKKYNIAHAYTDQRKMHEELDLDGILIATPDDLHREPVEIGAEAGVDIMLEKPIATTLADAEAILQAVEQAKVKLMHGFSLRFLLQNQQIKAKVDSGDLGQLTNAYARRSVRYSEGRRLYGRCSVNDYLGIHDIDQLLWMFGRDVDSVYATTGDFVMRQDLGVSDYYWNVIKWKNGATGVVHACWCEPETYPVFVEWELLLNGTKGSVHELFKGQPLWFADENSFETPLPHIKAYYEEADHFVDCVRLGTNPTVDGYDGLAALKILLAAEQSLAQGKPVQVDM
jgi:UDP-N-acetylglucosamine 3-dehydrogenase